MILFTIPYAGGSAWSYRGLEACLEQGTDIVNLELPGRGRRAAEPLRSSLEQLADDVFEQVHRCSGKGPYALFGHSMGALLAWLTACRLRRAGGEQPAALFLCGTDAPSTRLPHRRHLLPTPELVKVLEDMGGCPPQVLGEPELLAYFEPILRADLEAVETWNPVSDEAPVDVPLVVMVGTEDDTTAATAAAWSIETSAGCSLHEFAGNHFFLLQHWPAVASLVQAHLLRGTAACS